MSLLVINYTLWAGDNFAGYQSNLLKTINELDDGKDWDVEIKLHRKKKTNSQRNWLHKLFDIYANEIGLTAGQVKDLFKIHLFGSRQVMRFGVEITVPDGNTEDLERYGYSQAIERFYQLTAESGVALPDADRFWREG